MRLRVPKFMPAIVLGWAIGASAAFGAEDADAIYLQLFGEEIAAAKKSAATSDDAPVAAKLVANAEEFEKFPQTLKMLLSDAIALGATHKSGYEAAIQAANLWAKYFPDEIHLALEHRIAIRQRVYRSAPRAAKIESGQSLVDDLVELAKLRLERLDTTEASKHARAAMSVATTIRSDDRQAIRDLQDRISAKGKLLQRITALKSRLKAGAKSSDVGRELILIYLVDLESPTEAVKYTFLIEDQALKDVIKISVKKADDRTADEALALGTFYAKLTKVPTHSKQAAVYERAIASYEQFQALAPDATGLHVARVNIELKSLHAWLEKHHRGSRVLPADLKKGLVAHYSFDQKSKGAVRDHSGRNHHGVMSKTGAVWVAHGRGKGNGVIALNGAGGLVKIPVKALGNWNALTYAAWVKAPKYGGSSWPVFIGSYVTSPARNTTIGFWQSSGNLRLELQTSDGNFAHQGKHRYPVDQWFHAAMVYDGKAVREYINGVPGGAFATTGTLNSPTGLHLGQDHTMYDSLKGQLDDAMIYGRALTTKQIQKLYLIQGGRRR